MSAPAREGLSHADQVILLEVFRWARRHGWHRERGTYRICWFNNDGNMVALSATKLLTFRLTTPLTSIELRGPRTVTEALSVLAAIEFLPARFSQAGAQALLDHAEACQRYAAQMIMAENPSDMRLLFTAGICRAAESAIGQASRGVHWW
jgi:hypothetical protein